MAEKVQVPEIQESWAFHKAGYVFTIRRVAFKNFRKFHLQDHLYKAHIKLLNNEKPPCLIEVLHDMRTGLEEMIEHLQDFYRPFAKDAHLYLLFDDDDSLSFVGVTTGK